MIMKNAILLSGLLSFSAMSAAIDSSEYNIRVNVLGLKPEHAVPVTPPEPIGPVCEGSISPNYSAQKHSYQTETDFYWNDQLVGRAKSNGKIIVVGEYRYTRQPTYFHITQYGYRKWYHVCREKV